MSEQPPISPSRSLAGWNWRTYLAKSKGALKWVLAALVAYLTVAIAPIQPSELNQLLAAVLGFASKFGADVIDYWLTEGAS